MAKQIIIAEQYNVAAVFWEDQIQELVVATGNQQICDIYLGIVENVILGIDAAFVNIGDIEPNGFIHVTDLGPLRLRRTSGAITELLAPKQKVLVQVMKEPTGNKGPRLTGNITLPGRFLVLMPYGRGVNLSRRIEDNNERRRLRALAILIKPSGMGLLVRTEAEGKSEEAIMEDLEFLQKKWESIQQQANTTKAPALLNRDDDLIGRVLRDMYTKDVNRIVVDSNAGLVRVKQQLVNWNGDCSPEGVLIDHHNSTQPILDYFRVNAAIREALKPRVELPSGGYIIIEPTEALTVIDVNSGSFIRSATSRETVLWTNNEAATEIARQLRLRNIGGVIIVDFIDMDVRRDQLKLLEHFNQVLKADKAGPQIAQLSELGLVELTRKRQGKNIYELFGQPCSTCGGLGYLHRVPGQGESLTLETTLPIPNGNAPSAQGRAPVPEKDPTDKIALSQTEHIEKAEKESFPPLDLLNHPSYEEQGSNNNTNRRRRRRRAPHSGSAYAGREVITKEEKVSPENGISPESEPVRDSTPTKEATRLIKGTRRDETNLERICVEMTDLEQDVYALMGVSPLIMIGSSLNSSKSAIVSVKRPGEPDPEPKKQKPFSLREQLKSNELSWESDSEEEQSSVPEGIGGRPLIRRRRRRSSASRTLEF
ncbi:MAG: Rne/Rng family ribonuclease [Prochloron sp. SP5CPC1]|nr:Rne/Rng family ribonuclease [Candidatus Paraprochloron terpiosi SP5CPC1]